ncbi:PDZ domain-containing protein [Patescibacteria group bacterium]|nr:PDZ domain-containing protein [Patescibacteria group bacterium]
MNKLNTFLTVSIIAIGLITPLKQANAEFFDVTKRHPLYQIIENLERMNVITPAPSERFNPEDTITKAEFTEMVVRNIGIHPDSQEKIIDEIFINDIDKLNSRALYIYKSIEFDITDLNPETKDFNPKKPIAFLEGLQMLMRAEGIHIPKYINQDNWTIRNIDPESWMAPLLQKALEIELIKLDENGFFFPYKPLSKTNAVKLVYAINKDRIALAQELFDSTTNSNEIEITVDDESVPKLDMFLHVYQNVLRNYINNDEINQEDMMYKAIQGMLKEVDDPYTVFTSPSDDDLTTTTILSSDFEGIGAEIAHKDNRIVIISPLRGKPAEKAGLKTNDIIMKIDGISTENMSSSKAASLIRGLAGTVVELTIYREGYGESIYKVTRAKIDIQSVNLRFEDDIAIIDISLFKNDADEEFMGIAEQINKKRPNGIIIDLRNNSGGILGVANAISSYFIPIGDTITLMENNNGETSIFFSQGPGNLGEYPLVVLVNKGSASASEILAGALKDHKIATIVGETTYGKGTVQKLFIYEDNSEFKLTIAKWLTPNENTIDKIGITPDIVVENTEEDFKQNYDAQMAAAKKEIRSIINGR